MASYTTHTTFAKTPDSPWCEWCNYEKPSYTTFALRKCPQRSLLRQRGVTGVTRSVYISGLGKRILLGYENPKTFKKKRDIEIKG